MTSPDDYPNIFEDLLGLTSGNDLVSEVTEQVIEVTNDSVHFLVRSHRSAYLAWCALFTLQEKRHPTEVEAIEEARVHINQIHQQLDNFQELHDATLQVPGLEDYWNNDEMMGVIDTTFTMMAHHIWQSLVRLANAENN